MGIIRQTKSVKAMLQIFEQSQDALSVVKLIEQLRDQMNKTTVYRILDRLEEDGIVHSFIDKDGLKWYAKCHGCSNEQHIDTHPHFQCKRCGKIECLSMTVNVPKLANHQVDSADFLLVGQCAECLT